MIETQDITNLVLEGGGVGAIAYAGFLSKAESTGILSTSKIMRIAGVSSGAIAGLQIALNYSIPEIIEEIRKTDFMKFIDSQNGLIEDTFRLFTEEGLYKDEYLYQYIGKLIKDKTGDEDVTFHDIQSMKKKYNFKDFYVVATKLFLLNNQPAAIPFIFSHEHTPFARIIDAMRASTALPILFPPVRLHKESDNKYIIQSDGDIYVDGGIIESYPIRIFDYYRYMKSTTTHDLQSIIYNPDTLGLRLEAPNNIRLLQDKNVNSNEQQITSYLQYAETILYVLKNGQQEVSYANSMDKKRSIIIDTLGISSTDFNLTSQQKEELIKSGEKAAQQLSGILKVNN